MPELHPLQASPAYAEGAFKFLTTLGYQLEKRETTGGHSFRDGWRLRYARPSVVVTVHYADQQFQVRFERAGVASDFLAIDRGIFGSRSGLHGDMFPPQKLAAAIDLIAAQVHDDFRSILEGEEDAWHRIEQLSKAPNPVRHLP
jgi:hypothetical protein